MANRINPSQIPFFSSQSLPAEEVGNSFVQAKDPVSPPGPLMSACGEITRPDTSSLPVRPYFKKGERIEVELKGLHIEWLEGDSRFPVKVTDRCTDNIQHIHLPDFAGHFSICPVSEDAFYIQDTQSRRNIIGYGLSPCRVFKISGAGELIQRLKNLTTAPLHMIMYLINRARIRAYVGYFIR